MCNNEYVLLGLLTEGADEVWLGTEKREVLVVDILHIGRRKHSILLCCKVDNKRNGRDPFRSAVTHAHLAYN